MSWRSRKTAKTMAEEAIELQDSTTPAEEGVQEKETPVEAASAADTKVEKQDSAMYNLVKRAEKAEKHLKEALTKLESAKQSGATDVGLSEEFFDETMQLRDNGFNADEIKKIREIARARGASLIEASKDPFVLGGIKALREEAKARAATPAPTKRSSAKASKAFEEMSPKERSEVFNFQKWKESKRKGS